MVQAAIVLSSGSFPQYGSFPSPTPERGELLVSVSAASLSPLVRGQVSGHHYSSSSQFPFVAGVDGVGRLPNGERVYFAFPKRPYGSMAEQVALSQNLIAPLPNGVDDVTAAAIANPGMSSWAALTTRARLVAGETVLVNGATGSAGMLAVQIARHLGAQKVIATGRNRAKLEALASLGADVLISLEDEPNALQKQFSAQFAAGVNVVLDYLWGASAELIIKSVAGHGEAGQEPRVRFVQIGSISGGAISLPGAALRSSGLELMGSGLGSVSLPDLVTAIGEMLRAVVPAKLHIDMEVAPLADVETAWNRDTGDRRLVFTL